MSTKDIRTSTAEVDLSCDVCGRTLLRGERVHPYLERATQRFVCELCIVRADQEGWVREGAVPAYDGVEASSDRRRSLLGRLRRRPAGASESDASITASDELGAKGSRSAERLRPPPRLRGARQVRAIPSSAEQRIVSAVNAFNGSEHPRTVAGVARSLGLPIVSVRPVADRPSGVHLVVAWELCWYRYEVDLADEDGGVRVIAQGQELDELPDDERQPNALCDEHGSLAVA